MLLRFFEWRGATFVEERADEPLNRLARKLSEGVHVQETRAYAMQIARLVLLESFKGPETRQVEWDALPHEPSFDPQRERLEYLLAARKQRCLQQCLHPVPADSRQLLWSITNTQSAPKPKAAQHQPKPLSLPRLKSSNLFEKASSIRYSVLRSNLFKRLLIFIGTGGSPP